MTYKGLMQVTRSTSLGEVIKEVFLIINQREADDVEMVQHFRLRGWDCFESKGKNTPAPNT